ncbi:MAG: tetratricopeptide repeat protein, partial [Bacteroidia bacterium]|nr:tetratricopeptide repeat protein [Bacteroidia bacterium]
MKQLIFILITLFISSAAIAQKSAVQSGSNYLNYKQLEKAKKSLDAAVLHEKTSKNSKAWKLRGETYVYFHFANLKLDEFEDYHKFAGVVEDPLSIATESFQKAIEYGNGDEHAEESEKELTRVSGLTYNLAIGKMNSKDYEGALVLLEKVIEIDPEGKAKVLADAHKYAAACAGVTKKHQKAIDHYNVLLEMEKGEAKIYTKIAKQYNALEQPEKAKEYIEKGRELYPEDQSLLLEAINVRLGEENKEEAIELLDLAIANDPENVEFLFIKGNMYQQLGDIDKAAAGYTEALEKDENHFESIFHLGALYFNKGADLGQKARDLPPGSAYEKANKEMKEHFAKAKPYLEQALGMNPEHYNTLFSL